MSADEGIASQSHQEVGRADSLVGSATAGSGATKWRRLVQKEHRLVEEGREHLDHEVHEVLEVERRVAERIHASTTGQVWSRLNAVDFMNSSMQFSALALLCLFPFLILISAEVGGDARSALIRRLGLGRQAAQAVNALMSAGTHAAATLNVLGAAFVLLGAFGVASTLQTWYQKVFDQRQPSKLTRQLSAQVLWLVGFVAYLAVQDLLYRAVAPVGERVLLYVVFFGIAVVFYWWTQHVLLLGRIRWRRLFAGAVATGACVTGLTVFSRFVFSSQIVSSQRDYGSIGVVTVLLSYLIGFGVCLHLGAVVGQVWNERDALRSAAASQNASKPASAGSDY